jgi:arylsulfatase A
MLKLLANFVARVALLIVFSILVAGRSMASPKAAAPPNFIVILTDDLGYGDLGIYGSPNIRTPNLDRMAQEGVKLTSFYAAPVCSPARAMLLTGRYPIRSGMIRVLRPGAHFGLPHSEVTLAQALKPLGYATALIGKWHLGDEERYRPLHYGFDYFYGLLYSNDMTILTTGVHRLHLYRNDKAIESPVHQNTLTLRYTEETIKFIRENKDRPFFIDLAHSMPHFPQHASEAFRGKSKRGIYGDAVEELDWSTGAILKTLRELGLDGNTLVIFTSDNGPALGKRGMGGSAGPLRGGKKTSWEGGVRVPFIARWPGHIPAGRVQGGIASLLDIFPTLVELAGGQPPSDRPIDGRNILPMLEGQAGSPHDTFVYYFGTRIFAIRSGDWKLHFFKRTDGREGPGKVEECNPPELYNLGEDPWEESNVADVHPDIVARLTDMAEDFQASVIPGKLPPKRRLLP